MNNNPNDNILYIRTLVDRFFDGDTTLDEEQQLYAFFSRQPDCLPADLASLREMFLGLDAVKCIAVAQQHTEQPERRRWPFWAAAAAIALLLAGGAAVLFQRHAQPSPEVEEELVAYVYGERTTDHAVVLSEMQKTMTALSATDGADVAEEQLKSMFSNR